MFHAGALGADALAFGRQPNYYGRCVCVSSVLRVAGHTLFLCPGADPPDGCSPYCLMLQKRRRPQHHCGVGAMIHPACANTPVKKATAL